MADLEAFVVEEIRTIGRDPALVRETIAAARRAAETRKPGLVEELENLERREKELEVERRNLLDAVAQSGTRRGGLLEKLGAVETELDQVSRRSGEARAEIAVLENHVFDEGDLRRAIESFEPIWEQLFPAERARILQLLIETVTYDAREGEVEIRFRASGIKALAADHEGKETA